MLQRGAERAAAVVRRHRPDMLLLLFMCILVLLGLIIIYAISPPLAARAVGDVDPNHFMYRQVIYLLIGAAAFTAAYMIPVDFWRKINGKLLVGALILGTLPFVLQATPIGLCANGACRWLDFGFISFQPAEIMKFALVVFLASFLAVRIQQGKINDVQMTLVPVAIVLVTMAFIVIGLQQDLGTGITVLSVVLTMLFMSGLSRRLLLLVFAGVAALGTIFILIAPHRMERILTFINHSSSTDDKMGYHIDQALIAVGSGGLTGKGLGQSIQAFGYLPEAANDSIFAILAEIFGFLGTVGVLAIFAGLLSRLLHIMDRSANMYYRLVVAGIFGWIFSHTVVNIGAMLGIFPLTGITLPFVSFGGTSLLFMLAAIGVALQISRYTGHQTVPGVNAGGSGSNEDRRRGRGIGRPRDASSGSFSRA
ncbi:MAG TPA: putative peptidoglycan glycosyltransferase FtsW [Candidatus Saccharimonadales bacterium]|nr:putative peptidoglycan glycosyltransferase FtsW [Candidatus Saccharimonadales bacterium]